MNFKIKQSRLIHNMIIQKHLSQLQSLCWSTKNVLGADWHCCCLMWAIWRVGVMLYYLSFLRCFLSNVYLIVKSRYKVKVLKTNDANHDRFFTFHNFRNLIHLIWIIWTKCLKFSAFNILLFFFHVSILFPFLLNKNLIKFNLNQSPF